MSTVPRGRPRSERAQRAILAATRDLLVRDGYERMTMEQIAARAEVGKQTIYRWWPSKSAVVADAVLTGVIELPAFVLPDTGDLRRDLEEWFLPLVEALGSPGQQAVVRALAVAVAGDPEAGRTLYARMTGPEQDQIVARLSAARRRGQIADDADLQAASDALSGFVLFLVLARQPITASRARALLHLVLAGLGA